MPGIEANDLRFGLGPSEEGGKASTLSTVTSGCGLSQV